MRILLSIWRIRVARTIMRLSVWIIRVGAWLAQVNQIVHLPSHPAKWIMRASLSAISVSACVRARSDRTNNVEHEVAHVPAFLSRAQKAPKALPNATAAAMIGAVSIPPIAPSTMFRTVPAASIRMV